MRLNHLDLPVPDVAATREFFERWFGFTHERTRGQDGLSILRDESGLVLVISRHPRRGPQGFPETFHIGFHLDSSDAVREFHRRLSETGIAGDPPTELRGGFGFYFMAPGNILVEVAYRPIPS